MRSNASVRHKPHTGINASWSSILLEQPAGYPHQSQTRVNENSSNNTRIMIYFYIYKFISTVLMICFIDKYVQIKYLHG